VIRSVYEHVALIDTSAVIALRDPTEQFHKDAVQFYSTNTHLVWAVLDITSHETYTTVRYRGATSRALEHYSFLRSTKGFRLYRFSDDDEGDAIGILKRYADQCLSFHDALCAAAMKRLGIAKVFTFDRDFDTLGFVVLPGPRN